MKTRRRLVSAAALTSIVVLGALVPIATGGMHVAAAAVPNEVTNWNRIAADTLVAFPPPGGGAAPALQINMGMTQGAVYDAVNAIEPRHQPYLLTTRFDPSASKEAAVATAAYVVLSNLVSTVPATILFPNQASLLQSLDTAYAASLATHELLENAVKYGRGEIAVYLTRQGNRLRLVVGDQGPGIPAEEHRRIFERFYRTRQARGTNVRGSGIGLSLVKHIAEAHGGTVTVDSEPGRGAAFIVDIPLVEPPSRTEAA